MLLSKRARFFGLTEKLKFFFLLKTNKSFVLFYKLLSIAIKLVKVIRTISHLRRAVTHPIKIF
jgi:hypothetical protein